MASLNINQVRGGHKEELAKKLIKLFLATAILSPAKMGPSIWKTSIKKKRDMLNDLIISEVLPLPLPIPIEAFKPPMLAPHPLQFHPPIPFL